MSKTTENTAINNGMTPEAVAQAQEQQRAKDEKTFIPASAAVKAVTLKTEVTLPLGTVLPVGTDFQGLKQNRTGTQVQGVARVIVNGKIEKLTCVVPFAALDVVVPGGGAPRAARVMISHGPAYDAYIASTRTILKKNEDGSFPNMDYAHFQEYVAVFADLVTYANELIAAHDPKDAATAQAIDDFLSAKSHQHVIAAELRKRGVIA